MSGADLNLTFLRGATERTPGADTEPFRLSRRQLLGAGSSLALATTGISSLLQNAAGAVVVAQDGQRVSLRVGGAERWIIDAGRFGGHARVAVTEQDGVTRVTLSGARLPGTMLPADLTAELRQVGSVWRLRLDLLGGRFSADLPLLRWLAGTAAARSRVRLGDLAATLGAGGSLRLVGAAEATFTPDWQLRLMGAAVARLTCPEVALTAETVTLCLLPADSASLLQHAAGRRTLITLERSGNAWGAWPGLAALDGGRVQTRENPFDRVQIETQETVKGDIRQGLLAVGAAGNTGSVAYLPGEELTHPDGSPASFVLRNPRYGLAFGADGNQAALVARFSEQPTWVHVRGFTLQLADAPNARPFELVARAGAVTRRNVAPAVYSMAAAMPGAIVEPVLTAENGPIEIVSVDGMPVAAEGQVAAVDVVPAPTPVFPIDTPPFQLIARPAYISVLRSEDMLFFEVKFLNLRLVGRADGPPYLQRIVAGAEAFLLFRFPPQHVAEEAYFDDGDRRQPPIPSRVAGPSWLSFKLPANVTTLDYTLQSLLDWSAWIPVNQPYRVDPRAMDSSVAPFTAIEAPYRMFLSPRDYNRWRHPIEPLTLDHRTELWHTRLVAGTGPKESVVPPGVRAIWTPDYPRTIFDLPPSSTDPPLVPFRYSMDARMRYEIVRQSPAVFQGIASAPIRVENLMLTSQGAWMKIEGHWDPPDGLKYTAWRHEANMGRDQFVKVVAKGYLYPFGHKALLVTETQRRVEQVPLSAGHAAYLRQREFIIVVERERTYPNAGPTLGTDRNKRNRNMPLRKVTVLTTTTPNLESSGVKQYQVGGLGADAFWPRFAGDYFKFHMAGEDWEGQQVEFAVPVIWVSNIPVTGDSRRTNMDLVKTNYWNHPDQRRADMRGQRIAYAPRQPVSNPGGHPTGDTVLETAALTFMGETMAEGEDLVPPYLPQMDTADVKVASLAQLTNSAGPKAIRLDNVWLEHGFGADNQGMVFAAFDGAPAIAFGGDKSGAVLTPDMPLAGLSLSHGLVGGNTGKFGLGDFSPEDYFKDQGKILGGIMLKEIIDGVNVVTGSVDKARVPRITSKLHYPGDDTAKPPDAINTDLLWEPLVKPAGPFLNFYHSTADGDEDDEEGTKPGVPHSTLKITANLHTPLEAGRSPTYHVNGNLEKFTVNLADCIRLGFDHLRFTADSGADPKTEVGLTWVRFTGALEFVQKLRDALGDIFGKGFKLDVEPVGVRASFTFALPKIAMGVFALTNMSLSAGFDLPFTGKPAMVNFAFCSRENPFNLSVSMFGGGGFFGITLGLQGVEILEVAFEFGADVSIDLGVASGGVSVKAGIYFKYQLSPKEGALLEGYVKIHGEMTVLLIASLSITLYLSLTFKTPNKCWGQATLTVEIEILFISISAEVHAERQFSGDDHDPPFSQMITAGQWAEFTLAFAE